MTIKNLRARPRLSGSLVLGLGGFGLLASCQKDAPIDPEVMAQQAADRAADVFTSAALSAQGNHGAEQATSHLGNGLGTISGSFQHVPLDTGGKGAAAASPSPYIRTPARSPLRFALMSVPAFRALVRPLATPSLLGPSPVGGGDLGAVNATATAGADAGSSSELASDLDDTGQTLRRLLRERIFVAANLESKTDAEAIYLLHPDPTCRDLDDDQIDAACVKNLTKVELRVRLSKNGTGGTQLDLLVGSERAFPLRLIIAEAQLAAELYLADIKRTSAILATALGQTDDSPDVLAGTIRWQLSKDGPKAVSFASSILQAIQVEEKLGTSKPGVLHSAAADPVYKISVDGDKGTITGTIGLGATEFLGPWNPKGDAAPNTDLHLVTEGLTGQITFTQAANDVKLTGLGFGPGPTYAEARGRRIFQLDLNEQAGRAFDLGVAFDAQDKPILTVTPRFDLKLGLHFGLVAADYASPPPAHLLDETYDVALDPASGAGPVLTPWESSTSDARGLKLVAGKLTIASSMAAAPVVVSAGQCLVGRQPRAGDHPVIGALQAVDCPN